MLTQDLAKFTPKEENQEARQGFMYIFRKWRKKILDYKHFKGGGERESK